jgi:hypothetical protein
MVCDHHGSIDPLKQFCGKWRGFHLKIMFSEMRKNWDIGVVV